MIDMRHVVAAIVFASGMETLEYLGESEVLSNCQGWSYPPPDDEDARKSLYLFMRGETGAIEFGLYHFVADDTRGCSDPDCCGAPSYAWNVEAKDLMYIHVPEEMDGLRLRMWNASTKEEAIKLYDTSVEADRVDVHSVTGAHYWGFKRGRKRAVACTFEEKMRIATFRGVEPNSLNR